MFYELMEKRGYMNLPEQAKRQMMAYPPSKKWIMVHQDKLADFQSEQKRRAAAQALGRDPDEDSPEWYVKKIMDGTISAKQLGSLSVSLRTQPISWVKQFIEAQGQVALTTVLRGINNHSGKNSGTDAMLDREYDIVKCLKALMNNKYGADDALRHHHCVSALTASLTSPRVTTRKLVSEVLTFLCHWDRPHGHTKVLAALDQIKTHQGENGRFDSWLRIVEVTIDGRGKLGSLVGASDEVRSGGIGMESLLMEYALATLFLINIIASGADDLHARIHIRAQFKACGFGRIAAKMQGFQYELIDKQIQKYEEDAAVDYDELMERDGGSMVDSLDGDPKDLNDPVAIVDAIMSKVRDTRTQDYFMSTLQHLLLMRDNNNEDRLRMFQLVDSILGYVVMDRRLPDMDLKASLSFSVQALMDKLHTDGEARHALEEASEARQIAESAIAERDAMKAQVDMGADGLIAKLKKQLDEQTQVIEIQRRQNEGLKGELEEIKLAHAMQMQKSELETRELYLMLRDAQDAADAAHAERVKQAKKEGKPIPQEADVTSMKGILDRKRLMLRLETQLERKKTEFKLEGKVWQQVAPSDRLRELRERMDAVQREAKLLEREHFEEAARQRNASATFGSVKHKGNQFPSYRQVSVPETLAERERMRGEREDGIAEETDDDEFVEYAIPRIVEVGKRPLASKDRYVPKGKMNPAQATGILGEIAARVPVIDPDEEDKEGEARDISDAGDGVTTGRSHSSMESDSPKTPVDFGGPPAPGMPPPPMVPGAFPPSNGLAGSFYTGIRPKKKLKPMHWEKLDGVEYTLWANRIDKETMFDELSKKGILEEMERLFAFKETRMLKRGKDNEEKKKEFLDSGVVKSLQIALSKYTGLTVEQLVKKIISCDRDILDNTAIMDFLLKDEMCNISDNLSKNLAPYSTDWTETDAEKQKRESDPNELRREDYIYLETAYNLHHYWKSRIRALALTRSLDPDYTELQGKLHQVVKVSDVVRGSKAFHGVLNVILTMGNFMNDASKQATGFKLGTLSRLVNVKDEKNQRSFMDYIEMSIRNKFPEWQTFVDELYETVSLEKVDVDNLMMQAKRFIDNINNIQTSVDSGNLSDPKKFHPSDRVLQVVLPILPEARKKAGYLKDHLEAMTKTYDDLLTYYGEDHTDESSRKRFFKMISDFVKNYKASNQKNLELEDEEKRREKRKQLLNAASHNQKANEGPLSPNSSGAMEALFEKLKQAGPAQREKRETRRRNLARGGRRTASGASRNVSGASVVESAPGEQPSSPNEAPLSLSPLPSIPSSAAEEEDALTSKTQEMLIQLRGENSGDSATSAAPGAQGAGAAGSLRVRRRRGSGEDLRRDRRRRQGSNVSTIGTSANEESAEDVVAKAKLALMNMRRGSDDAIDDETGPPSGGLPTPTTIVSPPSPEPHKQNDE
ncbi:actin-binding FH2 [Choiromyces venosus 120613-1]|uniref:Actin-binding FH2 n=1 Tax=Choiromyces venosus 120613-1 TaxID=1336337 RepID=A0A3N4JPR4_9PEZI|nr:actin-binding FH2 [Choiromyces venosus 120613-1]